ncbi:MAG: MauE/DoxX family redox-associated membrane protein [Thermoleophilia bacterium]
MELTLRIVVAAVLLWAALGKLRDPRGFLVAVAEHGVPAPLRRAAAAAVIVAEAALAVLVLVPATARPAGVGVAVLGVGFAASLARLRIAGSRRVACGCFGGARDRPVGALAARAVALAVLGLLIATAVMERWDPSPGVLTAAAIGVLGVVVAVLAVLVLALYRQVGVLEARLGPRAALEIAEEGPPAGAPAPELAGLSGVGPELVAFASRGCRLCAEIEPALDALRRDGLAVRSVVEDDDPGAFGRYRVPGTPFVVYLLDGVVTAKGLVNTLEQIEELIAVGEERVGAPA